MDGTFHTLQFFVDFALVVVTGLAVYFSFKEGHRHEEVQTRQIALDERELVKVVHEVLVAEREATKEVQVVRHESEVKPPVPTSVQPVHRLPRSGT